MRGAELPDIAVKPCVALSNFLHCNQSMFGRYAGARVGNYSNLATGPCALYLSGVLLESSCLAAYSVDTRSRRISVAGAGLGTRPDPAATGSGSGHRFSWFRHGGDVPVQCARASVNRRHFGRSGPRSELDIHGMFE